jgi:hypothetical protein
MNLGIGNISSVFSSFLSLSSFIKNWKKCTAVRYEKWGVAWFFALSDPDYWSGITNICIVKINLSSVLRIRDQVLFDPWIRDEHPRSYFRELRNNFWVTNSQILCCGSGIFQTLDPLYRKFRSGIQSKHLGSATLLSAHPCNVNLKLFLVDQALGNLASAEANYLRALQLRQGAKHFILSLEAFSSYNFHAKFFAYYVWGYIYIIF